MKITRQFLSASLAIALGSSGILIPISPARADGGHSHGESSGKYTSVGQAWTALKEAAEGSGKAIASGDLKPIHEQTEQIEAAAKYMQSAGGITDEAKKTRADAALKQIVTLSGELHVAADGGDAAKSAASLKKLQGAMKLVQIQYPPEALK